MTKVLTPDSMKSHSIKLTSKMGDQKANHWIGGKWVESNEYLPVESPYLGREIAKVARASQAEVDRAVREAHQAGKIWREVPLKERCSTLFNFRQRILENVDELSQSVALESGKTLGEAKAGILKGIEVLEYALSLQNLDTGGDMEVSRGVRCSYLREPLGVVLGITPFNFPAMVPMWMIPLAIGTGNAFVWKPSEKVPLTSTLIAELAQEAGLPKGVLTVVQGDKGSVESLIDHELVQAVAFVGSTPIARSVYARATALGKRALCLGGAKNHIILLPDADFDLASQGIVQSYTGCAGQRCMAASVLLAVGKGNDRIEQIVESIVARSSQLVLGTEMGAIISKESLDRLRSSIEVAERDGAKILLDGRRVEAPEDYREGYWLGPTVLDQVRPGTYAATEELFGPVLSIIRCEDLSEALEIENSNPYGNACSVFSHQGRVVEEVSKRARAGMIGVNIGVPVPREPFSFGGFYQSRFGSGDITGQGGVDFWTQQKKITVKWGLQKDQNWMS